MEETEHLLSTQSNTNRLQESIKQIDVISTEAWDKLKKQIEYHLKEDNNLTDISINYQVKIPERGTRNYLNLNVTI
tara:strand:+ start:2783 stop:3010 length:228 start_codon:yes stop_codon:yes gene_type:complete